MAQVVTQKKFRVSVSLGGRSGPLVYDSGWRPGDATEWALPNGYLSNNLTYAIKVEIEDSNGLQSIDIHTVSTSWVAPGEPDFSVDIGPFENAGFVNITWSNSVKDATWVAWRVYRSEAGTNDWKLLYETQADLGQYAYQDSSLASGISYQWVVIQVANRFGSSVESHYDNASLPLTPICTHYWMIDTTSNPPIPIKLPLVTADGYTDEYEQQTLNLLGRGRKVDYGTRWGQNGSLTVKLYDDEYTGISARQRRQQIENMKMHETQVYLRNPFGDLFLVALGDIQVSRIAGVGVREFVEVTIPYLELAA